MATQIQDNLIANSNASLAEGRDVFLSAPTGAGKTRLFSILAANQVAHDHKVLVLGERQALVKQDADNLHKWSPIPIDTSICMDGDMDESGQVVYANIQTVHDNVDKLKHYDLVVIDEAHHAKLDNPLYTETIDGIIRSNPQVRFLAASATPPEMYEGLHPQLTGADKHIITFEEAIAAKLIDLPETLTPSLLHNNHEGPRSIVERHRKGTKTAALETGIGKDLAAARGEDWAEQLVSTYERFLAERKTLAFFDTIKEAEAFMSEAKHAGHDADIVHSKRGLKANLETMEAFRKGENRLLVSIDMISEGVDLDADGILLDKKTTSASEYKQIIGRESRSHGVDRAVKARLVDTGASTYMHGEISAIAAMQSIRGGIERRTINGADLLPDSPERKLPTWIEMTATSGGRKIWGTSIDGAIVYAAPTGDGYATLRSSEDRKGARIDLVQIDGERKGMPSRSALGDWLSDSLRRNEKALTRLIGQTKQGATALDDMVRNDWKRHGSSIERTIGMLATGTIAMTRPQQPAYGR